MLTARIDEFHYRVAGILLAGLLAAGILAAVFQLMPYTEDWLPVWVEQGDLLVRLIEQHRKKVGTLPPELPAHYLPPDFPGLVKVRYYTGINPDGSDYFKLVFYIHLRETLTYDSRHPAVATPSAGVMRTQGDWVYLRL
ncbi:MAG: hypothetical protein GX442_16850 [Candidatus Riflebacteria bacterium]|nr:hypothetical protein [Candidatus Riflebacteria bacterium]